MHLLTSSLFIPSYVRRFTGDTRRVILQSYALTLLHICVVRGRPKLFPEVAMGYRVDPSGPLPRAGEGAGDMKLPMVGDGSREQDNPWFGIVENAIVAYGECSCTSPFFLALSWLSIAGSQEEGSEETAN